MVCYNSVSRSFGSLTDIIQKGRARSFKAKYKLVSKTFLDSFLGFLSFFFCQHTLIVFIKLLGYEVVSSWDTAITIKIIWDMRMSSLHTLLIKLALCHSVKVHIDVVKRPTLWHFDLLFKNVIFLRIRFYFCIGLEASNTEFRSYVLLTLIGLFVDGNSF